jgi:VanZ family protein
VSEPRAPARGSFLGTVAPALLYAALVFWGGSIEIPRPPFEAPALAWDKLGHVLAFALMQLVWWRAVRYELPQLGLRAQCLLAASIAALLGGVLELYQSALPHRSAEVLDLLADVVGAGIAAVLVATRVQARTARLAASSSLTNE